MSNWKPISNFVKFTTKGITPKYVRKSSIMVLNQKCIRNNRIDYSFSQFTDDSKKIAETKFVKKGDVLVNSTGTGTAGRCAFISKVPRNYRLIVDSHILMLRCSSYYEAQCLSYILFSFEQTLMTFMTGSSGQSELDKVVLLNLLTKMPTDPILQQKIATVLSVLDSKIQLNNRINSELEAMAKTLYDYWFVQFDFPNKNGKPYKSSGGKMVWNEKLKRKIPEGWEDGCLGGYIEIERGISYTKNDLQSDGIPMINLNSFSLDGSYKPGGIKFFSGKVNNNKILAPGDLMIATTDVTRNADIIGKAFIVPNIFDNAIMASCDIAKVIPKNILDKHFLNMLFNSKSYHKYIKYFASGTLVLHLGTHGINWFKLPIPPKELLEKFSLFKVNIEEQKSRIIKENQQLIELRDWLLPMLMNGQVKVS